jgi:hypothetical protein
MQVAFAVCQQVPDGVTVTAGNGSEQAELRRLMHRGGVYVCDRDYTDYALFQELHDTPCSFIGRVQENAASAVQEERPVSAAAQAAGVCRDCLIRRLGTSHHTRLLPQPFRVVCGVLGTAHTARGPAPLV